MILKSVLDNEYPKYKGSFGINKAETFRLICNECDNSLFSDYENPENYKNDVINDNILCQIAMKTSLNAIYKSMVELNAVEYNLKNKSRIEGIGSIDIQSVMLPIIDELKIYNYAKIGIKGNHKQRFYPFCIKKLNYVVPYAYQGMITPIVDLEGNIINEYFNKDVKYKIQSIFINVFPFENSSLIICFIKTEDKRLKQFYKQFHKLDEEDQLSLINYMILAFAKNVIFSPKIDKKIFDDKITLDVISLTNVFKTNEYNIDKLTETAIKELDLNKRKSIINLLTKECSL